MSWVAYWKQKHSITKLVHSSHDMDIWAFPAEQWVCTHSSVLTSELSSTAFLLAFKALLLSDVLHRELTSEATLTSEEVLGEICKFPETSSAPQMGILQHPGSGLTSLLQLLQLESSIYLNQQLCWCF